MRLNRWAWSDVVVYPILAVMVAPLAWNLARIVLGYFGWID